MKYKQNISGKEMCIQYVEPGDTFFTNNEYYLMTPLSAQLHQKRAVELTTGDMYNFNNDTLVTWVEIEFEVVPSK